MLLIRFSIICFVFLFFVGCGDTVKLAGKGAGDSCIADTECREGLKCIDRKCTAQTEDGDTSIFPPVVDGDTQTKIPDGDKQENETSDTETIGCIPGANKCIGRFISTCNNSGTWGDPDYCPADEECLIDKCVPVGAPYCPPNDKRCISSSSYETCLPNGSNYSDPTPCPANELCMEITGECHKADIQICTPSVEKRCNRDGQLIICDETGKGWNTPENCPKGEVCSKGVCLPESSLTCKANLEQKCDGEQITICNSDGTGWNTPVDCPTGQKCENDKCEGSVATICEANTETRCVSETQFQICNDDGTAWSEAQDCISGEKCLVDKCVGDLPQVCNPDTEKKCDIDLFICNSDGTDWKLLETCPSDSDCVIDKCVKTSAIICEADLDQSCEGSKIKTCNQYGDGWDDAQECPDSKTCVNNKCETAVCIPGSFACGDKKFIKQCKPDGSGYSLEMTECQPKSGQETACFEGECIELCEYAEKTMSSVGCEYWSVVLPNPVDDVFKQGDESEFALVITNEGQDSSADVTITYTGSTRFSKKVTVAAETTETVRLPYYHETCGSTSPPKYSCTYKKKNAFHIASSIPVAIVQFNPLTPQKGETYSNTNDASLLLPTHVLGKEYMALSYPQSIFNQETAVSSGPVFFTIVGTEDNTTVHISSKGLTDSGDDIPEIFPETTYETTIDRGEVLQIASNQTNLKAHDYKDSSTCQPNPGGGTVDICLGSDLSGSLIETNKPVAAFSGNQCTYVPHYKSACDHLEQQLFPTNRWKTDYILGKMEVPSSTHPNIYIILAQKDETIIHTNPETILAKTEPHSNKSCQKALSTGDYCMIQTTENFILSSNANHPVLVGQFMVGQNFDSSTVSEGDPAFVLVPPVKGYLQNHVFLVPSSYTTDKITILSKHNQSSLIIDGNITNTNFKRIESLEAYVLQMDIADGRHTISAQYPVGLLIYGYDKYVSYAYPGGLNFAD